MEKLSPTARAPRARWRSPGHVAVMPAVDLEARKPLFLASLGVVGESLAATRARPAPPGRGRNWHRSAAGCGSRREAAPRKPAGACPRVPQRNVERTVPHVVVGADLSREILPDLLARVGVATHADAAPAYTPVRKTTACLPNASHTRPARRHPSRSAPPTVEPALWRPSGRSSCQRRRRRGRQASPAPRTETS